METAVLCADDDVMPGLGKHCTQSCGHCTCRPLPTFICRAPGTRAAAQLRKRSAESAWSASARSCAAAKWGLQVQRRTPCYLATALPAILSGMNVCPPP